MEEALASARDVIGINHHHLIILLGDITKDNPSLLKRLVDIPGYTVECSDSADTAKSHVYAIPKTFFMKRTLNKLSLSAWRKKQLIRSLRTQALMLVLEGQATEVVHDFEKAIERMPLGQSLLYMRDHGSAHGFLSTYEETIFLIVPSSFIKISPNMQIIDAYETNAPAGVFIRMTWESYARLLSTISLETVLQPSLDQLQRERTTPSNSMWKNCLSPPSHCLSHSHDF